MSSFRQLMMRTKTQQNNMIVPANCVMTKAGESMGIAGRTFTKTYDGFAYCGYFCYKASSKNWEGPMMVSEVKDNCEINTYAQVSSTTFNYKGKDWYYTSVLAAMQTSANQNNGRYFINNGEIFTGNDIYVDAAKALLDYVYSFDNSKFTYFDYIETTGSQYIDTGLVPTSNTRVVTNIVTTTTSQNNTVFGCKNNGYYYNLIPYDNKWYYSMNGTEDSGGTYSAVVGQEYEIDFNNNGQIIINNDIIAANINPAGNSNLLVSKKYTPSGQWQFKFFKIYENGVLIRNFVPAYVSNLSKYVFVDKANNMFYENQGSGDLIGGNY